MALIKCFECGSQVSNIAETCPKCAYPIAGGGTTQAHGGKIQTVEQTSKKYKLHQLLSSLLSIGSFVVVIVFHSGDKSNAGVVAALGTLTLLVGLIWFISARFMAWWHHG